MLQTLNLIILKIGTATKATQGIETSYTKIGTVVLVLCIVFAGITAYLFYTERSLSKLEKEIKNNE